MFVKKRKKRNDDDDIRNVHRNVESKKNKKNNVSWIGRISSSAVFQALMLATTKNRHFVAM
jgi:hypothetical protein